jgi:hypothetical protein
MWYQLLEVKSAYTAEMWKALFNAEALSVLVVPASSWAEEAELEPHTIYVPWGKGHVAREIMRKV